MANLKEVRTRIESVQSTRQITSAMKMVAASKLRKAQNAVMTLRPYSNRLNNILDNITASLADDQQSPFSEKREAEKVLMVLISSNKGLCGAFNTNVIKRAKQLIANKYKAQADAGNLQMICAGKKVSEIFAKSPVEVLLSKDDLLDNPSFDDVAALAEEVMQLFLEKKNR
jgi:F-type H+-transporting ATPase subunit gamma